MSGLVDPLLLTHTIFKNTKIVRQSREPTVVTYYTVGAFCIFLQLCKHRTAGISHLQFNLSVVQTN